MGVEGGLRIGAPSFYCRRGLFFNFFLKVDWSPSLFLWW